MTINAFNLTGAFPCNLGVPPSDDPKTFAAAVIFEAANTPYALDFIEPSLLAMIDTIQSVYIDNDTDARITLQAATGSFHRIIARPRSQGWYPIAMLDQTPLTVQASAIIGAPGIVLMFANVLMSAGPWATQ